MSVNSRAVAVKACQLVLDEGYALPAALLQVSSILNVQDKAYSQELAYGMLRFYLRYQAIINQWTDKPIKDTTVKLIVASGFYQLAHMRTATHAAVNETVQLTKTFKKKWATKLVNALLRRWQREYSTLALDTDAVKFAYPQWLMNRIKKAWPAQWQEILLKSHEKPAFELRVNLSQLSREDYCQQLDAQQIAYTLNAAQESGITLLAPMNVHDLPGFNQGLVSVQAHGAQWAASLLAAENHMQVLDACAAPGGKTLHILEQAPLANIIAVDIDGARLERVNENLMRHKKQAVTMVADVTCLPFKEACFDRILLDVPCSATGVIARHPDIKYLRRSTDIEQLNQIQIKALEQAWQLLKPQGILLYATCSILPAENDRIIETFLAQTTNVILLALDMPVGIKTSFGQQLLPNAISGDGFYYAKLQKAN